MIRVLPDDIIHKIAAGEVIERPASVVKELIENAIDARSSRITIEIEKAGQDLIRIADNGEGMTPEELTIAVLSHATSKLADLNDLLTLKTLGFRGEALPSIAAVSRLLITSQSSDSSYPAWKLSISGGEKQEEEQVARGQGTTVEVKDLFYNTPARKKFLKKDVTEQVQIRRIIDELCMAYPAVGFKVFQNKRESRNLPSHSDLHTRAAAVFGKTLFDQMLPVESSYPWITIRGAITRPSQWTSTRKDQYCFINQRPVFSRTVTRSLYDSFHGQIPPGRHPAAVFWLDINPDLVDVNVHPTKREVRISKEHELFQVMTDAIRKSLSQLSASPVFTLPAGEPAFASRETYEYPRSANVREAVETFFTRHAGLIKKAGIDEPLLIPRPAIQEVSCRVIGQMGSLYILAESEDELWIIDQHAAEERVLFESFAHKTLSEHETQKLLIPYQWIMPREEFAHMKDLIKELNSIGIEIEEFGHQTMIIRSLPAVFGEIKKLQNFLSLLSEEIMNGQKGSVSGMPSDKDALIGAACRAAVKSRDVLSKPQIEELIKNLKQCEQPFTCPHGRPTLIRLTRHEIDRRFGR